MLLQACWGLLRARHILAVRGCRSANEPPGSAKVTFETRAFGA